MKDQQLRLTDTNSADDSKGRTWGLDGNLFWHVIIGGFVFVITLLLLFSALRMDFWTSFAIASVPFALLLAYVFLLRQGKPPGYDVDLLDGWLKGRSFRIASRDTTHPLLEASHVAA